MRAIILLKSIHKLLELRKGRLIVVSNMILSISFKSPHASLKPTGPKVTDTLHGSTRDKKPLVDAGIDRGRWKVFMRRNRGNLVLVDAMGTRLGDSQVGTVNPSLAIIL